MGKKENNEAGNVNEANKANEISTESENENAAEASKINENPAACASLGKSKLKYAAIAVVIMLAVNLVFTGIVAAKVLGTDETADEGDPAQENDVLIAGEYTIESTEDISDAYKSGDDSKLDDIDKATLEMASDVLDKVIEKDMTDYEKEQAVYDWMVSNCKFDSGMLVAIPTTQDYSGQPYGVLKNHTGVCVGYATTFRLFMQMLDMECMVVHSSDLGHSWDLVKLDDGNWYHTDVYMAISNGGYSNFNMNDSMCSYSHTWNQDFFPAANGTKYNYAYINSKELDDVYKVPEAAKEIVDSEESGDLYYKFDKTKQTDDYTLASNMANIIANKINELGSWYASVYAFEADDYYVLCICIQNYDSSTDPTAQGISEEEYEKLQDAVDKVFD